MPGLFSFYKKGITQKVPTKDISLEAAVDIIRSGAFRDDVERLRSAADKSVRTVIKNGLPYFTFSGTFKQRTVDGLLQHSGIICLDFDDVEDVVQRHLQLSEWPWALACFVSPSGTGLKLLVKINPAHHLESFRALESVFAEWGLELDKSGKDVSRACYTSYDPGIFYNPDAPLWEVKPDESNVEGFIAQQKRHEAPQPENLSDDLKHVADIIAQLEELGKDITDNDYDKRLEVGFALSTFGEEARELYHRAVQFNDAYTEQDANYKFTDALTKGRFTSPAKFFALAKSAGVDIRRPKTVTTAPEPAPQPSPEQKNFSLTNPDPASNEWYLVTSEDLLPQLIAEGKTNLVTNLMATTKEVCAELRAIGKRVVLISAEIEADAEVCLSLVAQGFLVSVAIPDGTKSLWLYLLQTKKKDWGYETEDQTTLCENFSWYPNAFEREEIAKEAGKAFKSSKATVLKEINAFIAERRDKVQELDEDDSALPAWVSEEQRDAFYKIGWFCHVDGFRTGIWFNTGSGLKQLTNFVITPLIHIYTKDDQSNRRLTELNNGLFKTVVQLPGKFFTSQETFDAVITSEGNFYTYDGFTKSHLNRLKSFYLGEYPKCFELNTLGWQPEGFFSFSNVIYKKQLVEYNSYGIANIEGTNFLSMGASNALDGVRAEDDIYKNDKFLSYKQSEITFRHWCGLMQGAYPEHGMVGVVFVAMALFRDILFKRNRNFPLLYPYGPISSGKSKFAESVTAPFTGTMPMFNLNGGTDFAFYALLGRFHNVAVGLNEFDENAIKEEWFRAIKGAYDGEGRQKGTGRQNKTTEQQINVAVVLIGQFLSTRDDNSVLSRTMPCKFTPVEDRDPKQVDAFNELKQQEQNGLSSLLCEILDQRDFVADNFLKRFATVAQELKATFNREGVKPRERVVENYTVALAMASLMGERLPIGFTYEQFFAYCKAQIIAQGNVMAESNALSQFWKTVEFLLDQDVIEYGKHFKVETKTEVRIAIDRKNTETKDFTQPKKLLFLRLGTIHQLYLKETRSQTGKTGLNQSTIESYMKDQAYYIGSNPASRFKDSPNTSSYVLDYDLLGVNLERDEAEVTQAALQGVLLRDAEAKEILNQATLEFVLSQDESYVKDGLRIKKDVHTTCQYANTGEAFKLTRGKHVKVNGILTETPFHDKVIRRMKVTTLEFMDAEPEQRSDAEVDKYFGGEG